MFDPESIREIVAAAIANARGSRHGVPEISNVLVLLPPRLREEVTDDADAVMRALTKRGLKVVSVNEG